VRRFFSRRRPAQRGSFCNEPWLGVVAIQVDQDVTFCPCYLKLRLGNLGEQPLAELWNAPALVAIRRDFREGRLPAVCAGHLCGPAVGADTYLSRIPELPDNDAAAALPGPA
jgi:hypothetical protein